MTTVKPSVCLIAALLIMLLMTWRVKPSGIGIETEC